MNAVTQLKSLLQEAELYRSQGLFNEAKTNYLNASKLIKKISKHLWTATP
jgi:hypothetical protein